MNTGDKDMNETEKYKKYYTGCKAIFEHYGEEAQKQQLIQECAELIQAVTKGEYDNFVEELADVQVVIDQFTINSPELDKNMRKIQRQKVKRQIERLIDENRN